MNDEFENQNLYIPAAMGVSLVTLFWVVGYLWHIGPPMFEDSPWWAFPYYVSVTVGGFAVATLTGAAAALLVNWLLDRFL
jgi:low affinity Fe/Cu permease